MSQAQESEKASRNKNAVKPPVQSPQSPLGNRVSSLKKGPKPMPPGSQPADPQNDAEKGDWFTDLWLRFSRFGWDVLGVGLIAFALMTLVGFINITFREGWNQGFFISRWISLVTQWFGWGWPLTLVAIILLGLMCLRRRFAEWPIFRLWRVLALEGFFFSLLTLLAIWNGWSLSRAEAGMDGGVVGWGLAELLDQVVPVPWGTVLVIGLMVLLGAYGSGLMTWMFKGLEGWLNQVNPDGVAAGLPALAVATGPGVGVDLAPEDEMVAPPLAAGRDASLPPLELLLTEQNIRPEESDIQETASAIEHTLEEFGVPANVVGYRVGPTVTQFAVEPGFVEKTGPNGEPMQQKVRVSQISALSRDLALALSAERLRIEAPVPGRSYMGIEVPNRRSALVRLRPMLESDAFLKLSSPLSIALGQDVSGQPVVADLARMPHLLIAGTTGSGKSVCIAAIATCLVMNNTPATLRMALLDPKMVELVRFNGLPHLFGRVETEVDRMLGVLRWALMEMDHRYKLLENAHTRDIITYNRKMEKRAQPTLPRIVVIIDELADLMMTAPDQTEHSLIRLAQMARATGIHLVVATQRPSTDVVTGLIKANFPARLAFTVASSIDSRVILDNNGAETLLGKGDMLFLNPESGTPQRAQGVLISDEELDRVIAYWVQQAAANPATGSERAPWEDLLESDAEEDGDALVEQAIKIVRSSQRASTSLLQRRLRVGYPRAARLMDELEDLGVVGPSQGGGRERDVLLPPDDGLEDDGSGSRSGGDEADLGDY